MLDIGWEVLILLIITGGVAGFIDAVAGGGGLLTMPALLFAGLSPAQAVATNKLQGSFGTFSAVRYFIKQGLLKPQNHLPEVAAVFFGAMLGAIAIQLINPEFLGVIMPWVLIAVACYFLLTPAIGDIEKEAKLSKFTVLGLMFSIGAYDGFFGPGTGTFFALILVVFSGLSLKAATAQAKLYNFTSNIVSLMVFIVGGNVVWQVGLMMALGQSTGAYLGAKMVHFKGVKIIRPITIVMCIAMSMALIIKG